MPENCRITEKPCLLGCQDRGHHPHYCFIDSGTDILAYGNAGKKIGDLDQGELQLYLGPETFVRDVVLTRAQHKEYKKLFLDALKAKLALPKKD